MRISDHIILPVVLLGLGLTTAHALEFKSPANAVPEIPGVNPVMRPQAPVDGDPTSMASFFQKMQLGDTEGALKELEAAFRNGNVSAGWKLGRMYADGDGVPQDRKRASEYFRKIIEIPEEARGPSARFVAYAWVAMGLYYQTGIPNSDIKPDPVRAYQNFNYAAVNFADADAQYFLARAYLDGQGVAKDAKQAAKWMYQAATKDQYEAQAKFGSMLFLGQAVPRDAAKGLMWLEIAKYTAPKGAPGIQELYSSAWKQATDEERAAALVYFEQWKRGRSARSSGHNAE
jgi:TPR repeat protein